MTPVGAPGTVDGVAGAEAADGDDGPVGAVEVWAAVTVKVYGTPLVRPVTVHEVAPLVVQVFVPGFDVTTYWLIVAPPV